MNSNSEKNTLPEIRIPLRRKAGGYVRCIESDTPLPAPTPTSTPASASSPAPRNLEFVCEVEVAGGNGLSALSGGSITFDGRSIALDLDLTSGAQAIAASPQLPVAGFLPAPESKPASDTAPYLRQRPSSHPQQVPQFYLDPDFDQALSEELEPGPAVPAWSSVRPAQPFPGYQPAAPAFQPQQGPTFRNAPYAPAPAVAPAAAPTANQPPKAEAAFQEHHDPAEAEIAENQPKKKKNIIGDIIFYAFLIALVVGAFFISGGSGGGPKMIAGYSAFTVTTGSMHDVLPQGSLIVTKHVEPEELQVGDDITYMISETSSITHRIIGIERNVEGTGELAFKTKGTMNDNPDKNLVPAVNVVGKVVFCSYPLGVAIGFVQDNWPLLIFLTVVAAVLFSVLRRILR